MVYKGSKRRIARHILPTILKNRLGRVYVEPFAGGMNTICSVTGSRLAADNNRYLIALWQGLQLGKVGSSEISREFYGKVRTSYNNQDGGYDDFTIGWVGFMGSANGRFFEGGYSGISATKVGKTRNYIDEAVRNIKKQVPLIQGVEFKCCDYKDLYIPKGSIVYCDPPYANTSKYAGAKRFNHDEFWDWVRMISIYNEVFVSEYKAPDDFDCLWEKEVVSSLSANGVAGESKQSTEKLFRKSAE